MNETGRSKGCSQGDASWEDRAVPGVVARRPTPFKMGPSTEVLEGSGTMSESVSFQGVRTTVSSASSVPVASQEGPGWWPGRGREW